ncbi:MAG: DNA polymerase III subunit delta' [Bacteroidota bacterium]
MKFSEVIGQEAAKHRVRDAISANRLAHATLLVGPPGVGQLAFATAIAQYMNCLHPVNGDSCGKCSNCLKISKGIHPDVNYILPIISKTEGGKRWLTEDFFGGFRDEFFEDPYFSYPQWQRTLGGENKQLFISVHEIRALKRRIFLKAFEAPYKVVIVWNAERINTEGANAFLKLLEEPPDRTLIIMTCSDPSQLLTTINSRCQRIPLRRIGTEEIAQYLVDKKGVEANKAAEMAGIAEGSIGNANEYLTDSSLAMSEAFATWLRAIYTGQYDKIQEAVEPIYKESKEFQKLFLQISIKKIRDSLLFHLGLENMALSSEAEKAFQQKFSAFVDAHKVDRISQELEQSYRDITGNGNAKIVFTDMSIKSHRILRGID